MPAPASRRFNDMSEAEMLPPRRLLAATLEITSRRVKLPASMPGQPCSINGGNQLSVIHSPRVNVKFCSAVPLPRLPEIPQGAPAS